METSRAETGLSASKISSYTTALITIQVVRIIGALFLFEYQKGNLPAVFAIPAGVGDILVGITAPIVALSIRKGSPLTLALALTWNALGIADLVYAVTVASLGGATYVLTSYLAVIPAVFVPLAIILHVAAIVFLVRGLRRTSRTV